MTINKKVVIAFGLGALISNRYSGYRLFKKIRSNLMVNLIASDFTDDEKIKFGQFLTENLEPPTLKEAEERLRESTNKLRDAWKELKDSINDIRKDKDDDV